MVGAIPIVGDIFDIGWKANLRNLTLVRYHVRGDEAVDAVLQGEKHPEERPGVTAAALPERA